MTDEQDPIPWFRASTAYINAHRGKVFVVLISGEALSDANLPNLVCDLSLLHGLGVRLVLVHGARPQIDAALAARGHESRSHRGLRITDADSIGIIKQTVGGLGLALEARFSMGMQNSPMHGADISLGRGNFVTAKPVGIHDGVDFQYTGTVRRIRTDAIKWHLDGGHIVMLSNLGHTLSGEVFNLSAEEVATETAIALQADKLILLLPRAGVMDEKGALIPSLSEADAARCAEQLASARDADSLCVSRALDAALRARRHGVHRCHLLGFREDGALLRELFTRDGSGTLISHDNFDQLRDATIDDVAGIIALIKPLEEDGTLVQRPRELLENEIGNFSVIELEDVIVACAALYPVSPDSAEIACIAIHPHYQGRGFGEKLLAALETTARTRNLDKLFVLTTVADHWFREKGFEETAPEALPQQKRSLYNQQRKSRVLRKTLTAARPRS